MRIEQKRKNGMEWERKDGNRIGQEKWESNSIGRIGSKQGKGVNGKKKGQEGWEANWIKRVGKNRTGYNGKNKGQEGEGQEANRIGRIGSKYDRKIIGQKGLEANRMGRMELELAEGMGKI